MPKKKPDSAAIEFPLPRQEQGTFPSEDQELEIPSEELADVIPDEDPFETPPYEAPVAGEGP